ARRSPDRQGHRPRERRPRLQTRLSPPAELPGAHAGGGPAVDSRGSRAARGRGVRVSPADGPGPARPVGGLERFRCTGSGAPVLPRSGSGAPPQTTPPGPQAGPERNTMLSKLIPMLLALLASVIGLSEDMRDPAMWVASSAALGGVVWATVQFLRSQVLPSLDGAAVLFASLAVGAGLGAALGAGGYEGVGTSLIEWLSFGLSGGFAAVLIDQG